MAAEIRSVFSVRLCWAAMWAHCFPPINLAMQTAGGTPDDLTAWIKSENERWGPIMKAAAVPM